MGYLKYAEHTLPEMNRILCLEATSFDQDRCFDKAYLVTISKLNFEVFESSN